jgi:hypothetical protein
MDGNKRKATIMCNAPNSHINVRRTIPHIGKKMEAIANISFPWNPADIATIAQDTQAPEESGGNTDSIDGTAFTVCSKMLEQLLRRTSNTSVPGLDRI